MSVLAEAGINRRTLLYGGLATTGLALLGGVGDKLLANRSFADFIKDAPGGASIRDRLNQGLAECAAAGQLVVGSAGTYALDGPLHIPAGLRVECEPGCIVQKAYRDIGSGNALLLTAGDQAAEADGFSWSGGEFRPRDASLGAGNLATLFGRGWVFRNAVMRAWRGGQCFVFGGGGFQMTNIDATSDDRRYGTGVYRCVWNDPAQPSLCSRLVGIGGDDVFQAVPVSAADHPRFGMDIGGLTYDDCQGVSHSARLIAVGIVAGNPRNKRELPSRITDCTFRNVRGRGGNRTVAIVNTMGDARSRVDNIVLDGCDLDCSEDFKGNADSVHISSDRNAMGVVRIANTRVHGSVARAAITANGLERLAIEDRSTVAGANILVACGNRFPVGQFVMRNSRLIPGDRKSPPVSMRVKDTASFESVTVDNVPSVAAAIRMAGEGRLLVR